MTGSDKGLVAGIRRTRWYGGAIILFMTNALI